MRHFLLCTILSFTGIFCQVFAYAQEKCASVLSSDYSGRMEVLPEALWGPKASEFTRTLDTIDTYLGPLQPATEVRVRVGTHFAFSHFNALNFNIYIGLRPKEMGDIHPKVHQGILAHEYGHAIFEKNLLKDLESYKILKKEFVNLALFKELSVKILYERIKTLSLKADVTFNKVEKQKLINEAYDLAYQIKDLISRQETANRYWAIRQGFHEVFADTIALVLTKDPKVISDAVLPRNSQVPSAKRAKEHSKEKLASRDFTDGEHHRDIQTWLKEQVEVSGEKGDFYFAFLPARWELWNIVKNKIDSENYRKELSYKVFSILERNLSEVLNSDASFLGPSGLKTAEKINQQLIEDFRREL